MGWRGWGLATTGKAPGTSSLQHPHLELQKQPPDQGLSVSLVSDVLDI